MLVSSRVLRPWRQGMASTAAQLMAFGANCTEPPAYQRQLLCNGAHLRDCGDAGPRWCINLEAVAQHTARDCFLLLHQHLIFA